MRELVDVQRRRIGDQNAVLVEPSQIGIEVKGKGIEARVGRLDPDVRQLTESEAVISRSRGRRADLA